MPRGRSQVDRRTGTNWLDLEKRLSDERSLGIFSAKRARTRPVTWSGASIKAGVGSWGHSRWRGLGAPFYIDLLTRLVGLDLLTLSISI